MELNQRSGASPHVWDDEHPKEAEKIMRWSLVLGALIAVSVIALLLSPKPSLLLCVRAVVTRL